MQYLDTYPYYLPFTFTNIPGALGTNVAQVTIPVTQGDFLVRGITTWDSVPLSFNFYRLSWWDQRYNARMMNDELSMGAFEADAQIPFTFPVPWVVKKGSLLTMQLRNMTGILAGSRAANISTQHVLYGNIYPKGYLAAVDIQPWLISQYFNLGFQEDTISGGNVVDSYNLNCSFSKTMDPLKFDFELRAISSDTLNLIFGYNAASFHRLKIMDKKTGRILLDKSGLIGNVSGLRANDALTVGAMVIPAGFPTTDTLQYPLSEPIMFKKDSVIDIHLGMAFNYGPTVGVMSSSNGECNVVLIGVRS